MTDDVYEVCYQRPARRALSEGCPKQLLRLLLNSVVDP